MNTKIRQDVRRGETVLPAVAEGGQKRGRKPPQTVEPSLIRRAYHVERILGLR